MDENFKPEYFWANPPWVVMPEVDPDSASWKQGQWEAYMGMWWNFWENLNAEEKEKYLKLPGIPKPWSDYISNMEKLAEIDN